MRIVVTGTTSTIGRAVATALAGRGHEVVPVSSASGPHRVDLVSKVSIR